MADARADQEVVGLPDTDQSWTIVICSECRKQVVYPHRHGDRIPDGHSMVPETATERVEVVPVEALSVEREARELAESSVKQLHSICAGHEERYDALRSVALGVAADLRKWAETPSRLDFDCVPVHRAKLLSRAARLEGKEDG